MNGQTRVYMGDRLTAVVVSLNLLPRHLTYDQQGAGAVLGREPWAETQERRAVGTLTMVFVTLVLVMVAVAYVADHWN